MSNINEDIKDIKEPLKVSRKSTKRTQHKLTVYIIVAIFVSVICSGLLAFAVITDVPYVPPENLQTDNKIVGNFLISATGKINVINIDPKELSKIIIDEDTTVEPSNILIFTKLGNHTLEFFFKNKTKSFNQLFKDVTSLIEVNLSYVNTELLENLGEMFSGCVNLQKINTSRKHFS